MKTLMIGMMALLALVLMTGLATATGEPETAVEALTTTGEAIATIEADGVGVAEDAMALEAAKAQATADANCASGTLTFGVASYQNSSVERTDATTAEVVTVWLTKCILPWTCTATLSTPNE